MLLRDAQQSFTLSADARPNTPTPPYVFLNLGTPHKRIQLLSKNKTTNQNGNKPKILRLRLSFNIAMLIIRIPNKMKFGSLCLVVAQCQRYCDLRFFDV